MPTRAPPWCSLSLVLRLSILHPFGVRVDWSSLIFCPHSFSPGARYAEKGFEYPILSSFSDAKLVSIFAKKFLDLIFFWHFMVFKMVLVYI